MNENLNLVEILKDCPKGTKLYSTIYGEVEFDGIINESEYTVKYVKSDGSLGSVTAQGLVLACYDGECTLFPSKDQRDWSKFQPKKPKFDPKTLQPYMKVLVRDAHIKNGNVRSFLIKMTVQKQCTNMKRQIIPISIAFPTTKILSIL